MYEELHVQQGPHAIVECATLWGKRERVHMHVEQFYIQDCHQNVTA